MDSSSKRATSEELDSGSVTKKSKSEAPTDPLSINKAFEAGSHLAANLSLFTSGAFSDLTVVCQDRSWRVHKAVVATRCAFFATAINGGFKETEETIIRLDDDDPEAIRYLLQYLYTKHISLHGTNVANTQLLISLITVADKYCLPGLVLVAKKQLKIACDKQPIELLPLVIEAAYSDFASDHLELLIEDLAKDAAHHIYNLSCSTEDIDKLLGTYTDFSSKVMKVMAESLKTAQIGATKTWIPQLKTYSQGTSKLDLKSISWG